MWSCANSPREKLICEKRKFGEIAQCRTSRNDVRPVALGYHEKKTNLTP